MLGERGGTGGQRVAGDFERRSIPAELILRRRHRGASQYEKLAEAPVGELLTVREGQAQLLVNLWQYLDTGLFLDHRPLRLRIAREAAQEAVRSAKSK